MDFSVYSGVADPDLDPDLNPDSSDPYIFGPPGSGSGPINQRYGSGSGSFYHQAKIVRKILIPTVLWLLFDFLSLKNDVNIPSKSNKQKNFFLNLFCVGNLMVNGENSRIRIRIRIWIISQRHGSVDPDPHQNVMEPQHWFTVYRI